MTERLEEYQRKLGAPPVPLRNVIKAADLEPVHQPDRDPRWLGWLLVAVAVAVLVGLAAWIGGAP
jgi:hypothetical protein